MKKLLFGTFAIVALSISSCAKDYTCECAITHNEKNEFMGNTVDETYKDVKTHNLTGKEDDMKKACEDAGYEISYKDQLNTQHKITSVCSIK